MGLLQKFEFANNRDHLSLIDHGLEPSKNVHVITFQVRKPKRMFKGQKEIACQHDIS